MSRVLSEDVELDVELDVVEQPEQSNFPRSPNVVSHRGHQLRINVTITSAPLDRRFVTLSAIVYAYGPERLGEQGHVSRERNLWGTDLPKTYPIDPDPEKLPQSYSIIVSEDGDDHLGQGPYDAFVGVNTSTEPPPDEIVKSGKVDAAGDESMRTGEPFPESASIFRIGFTSM
jgi:hypothetical protein